MGNLHSVDLVVRDRATQTVLMATGFAASWSEGEPESDAPIVVNGFLQLADSDEPIETHLTFEREASERLEVVESGDTVTYVDRASGETLPFSLHDYKRSSVLREQYEQILGVLEGPQEPCDVFAMTDPIHLAPLLIIIPAYCLLSTVLHIHDLRAEARESREAGIPVGLRLETSFGVHQRLDPDGSIHTKLECGVTGETTPMPSGAQHKRRRFTFPR